jgi:integrase
LAQVRDIFVFCVFTGLAFSDVKQRRPEHIATDINGAKWIRKARQKMKNMCNILLLEIPLQIIERYRNHPYCAAHEVLLPVLCNQKMNAYLKELADICGIKKQITTHTTRHGTLSAPRPSRTAFR